MPSPTLSPIAGQVRPALAPDGSRILPSPPRGLHRVHASIPLLQLYQHPPQLNPLRLANQIFSSLPQPYPSHRRTEHHAMCRNRDV